MKIPSLLPFALMTLCAGAAHAANDYPTVARVTYVYECMHAHPANSSYEMINKCSCALDHLADQMSFADFDYLVTASKAASIAGERGGELRDNEALQKQVRAFRKQQAEANQACFIAR
jgi:hypothetical protein